MTLTQHLTRVKAFFKNYTSTLGPVLVSNRVSVVRVTTVSVAGGAARSAMIGYIAYFVNVMQSSSATIVPIVQFELHRDLFTLILLGAGVFLLNAFDAWAAYDAALITRKIGRYAHVQFMTEVLNRFQQLRALDSGPEPVHALPNVTRQVMRNAVQLGISAETAVRFIQPAVYFMAAVAIALKIDAMLTFLLAPLVLVAAPFVYRISSTITRDSRAFFEQQLQDYGSDMSGVIGDINSSTLPHKALPFTNARLLDMPRVKSYLYGFDRIQLANEQMSLATALTRTFFLAIGISVFGIYALHEERTWGSMLAYVLALYYVIISGQTIGAYLANLNRFYPQLLNFQQFSRDADSWLNQCQRFPSRAGEMVLQVADTGSLPGSEQSLRLERGGVYYLHSVLKPSRLDFGRFLKPLEDAGAGKALHRGSDFVSVSHRIFGTTLAQRMLGQDAGPDDRAVLREALNKLDLGPEVDSLPRGIDTFIDEHAWQSLSPALKAALRVAPAVWSSGEVLFIDNAALVDLNAFQRQALWKLLNEKLVFIITNGNAGTQLSDAGRVLVVVNSRLAGIGSIEWYQGSRERIVSLESRREAGPAVAEEIISTL